VKEFFYASSVLIKSKSIGLICTASKMVKNVNTIKVVFEAKGLLLENS